ncbi:ATP-binding protein [Sinimarinibacterium sp. CAU 1509]|uniref:ATP-binding protein n=1 Tax=Sinimarinibacterium sp. CAU 1509 TaxID=2562283 RepID=UPI0010ABB57D|nr:ATP-binding protein [Sinimarinibacterium sp. CAU 1509]TJY57315.1 ATP-binding protein [Sinimarinibacterium sp. CAU 1509]
MNSTSEAASRSLPSATTAGPTVLALPVAPGGSGEAITVDLAGEATTIFIVGVAGTGKTVAALTLARQLLERGAPEVHYCTPAAPAYVTMGAAPSTPRDCPNQSFASIAEPLASDLGMRLLKSMGDAFPDRVRTHVDEGRSVEAVEAACSGAPGGAVIVVDDLHPTHWTADRLLNLMSGCSERRQTLVSPCQALPEIPMERLPEFFGLLSALMMGRLSAFALGRVFPTTSEDILEALERLDYTSPESRDFVAMSSNPPQVGIVRIDAPAGWRGALV